MMLADAVKSISLEKRNFIRAKTRTSYLFRKLDRYSACSYLICEVKLRKFSGPR